MAITDELRNYIVEHKWCVKELLTAIADRIDAEHERMQYGFQREFDDWKHDRDACWVKLPVDADGEVIHIGDVVVGKEEGGDDFIFEVYEIAFFPDGSCSVRAANDYGFDPWQVSHHHEPTVEDVLTEFARECLTYATCVDDHEVTDAIELYAPKLRLAGDAE